MRIKAFLLALSFGVSLRVGLCDDHLSIGVAVTDITPPVGRPLAGFGSERSSKTLHDPLYAKALVLRSKVASLALVSSDSYDSLSPNLLQKIQRELKIEHVILISTHSHSAPALNANGPASDWSREVERRIFETVSTASKSLFLGKLGSAQRTIPYRGTSAPGPLGHNIRVIGKDGAITERWSNPTEEGTAPTDPAISVIRIDDLTGKPRVVIAHYACQPMVLGPSNYAISGDYPAAVCRFVEKKLGGGVICIFVTGGAANIYPFHSKLAGPAGFEEVEKMGQLLGMQVLESMQGIKMSAPSEQTAFPRLDTMIEIRENTRVFRRRSNPLQTLNVRTLTVLINRDLAIVPVPADMFVEFQLALRDKSPIAKTLLFGHAYSGGDWIGTVPTIEATAEGGDTSYQANIEVGAGETIVDDALIQLYRILGKLEELPRGTLVQEIPDTAKTAK